MIYSSIQDTCFSSDSEAYVAESEEHQEYMVLMTYLMLFIQPDLEPQPEIIRFHYFLLVQQQV